MDFLGNFLAIFRIITVYLWFNIGSLIVLPVFILRPFNRKNDYVFGSFVGGVALKILGITYEIDHPERHDKSTKVWIANHQDSLDLFLLSQIVPEGTVVVGKKSLIWVPLFGQIFWLGGNFLIDRSNRQSAVGTMDKVRDSLMKNEGGVFILPEGTRSKGAGLGPFKKGAFHVAISSQVPIQPMVVPHFHREVNLKKWKAGHLKIQTPEPVSTKGMSLDNLEELILKVRQIYVDILGERNSTKG